MRSRKQEGILDVQEAFIWKLHVVEEQETEG